MNAGERPIHLDLDRERGLTVEWADGTKSFLAVALLRRMSPSADARHLREELARNPLTVLPSSGARGAGGGSGGLTARAPLTALSAELVGNYAVRIHFSDGHDTGIYSWSYLKELARAQGTGAE